MPELEAQVCAVKHLQRDGQFDLFGPARAVTVIQDKRAVLIYSWLPGAATHQTLRQRKRELETDPNYIFNKYF